jgi:hypothetical protein
MTQIARPLREIQPGSFRPPYWHEVFGLALAGLGLLLIAAALAI